MWLIWWRVAAAVRKADHYPQTAQYIKRSFEVAAEIYFYQKERSSCAISHFILLLLFFGFCKGNTPKEGVREFIWKHYAMHPVQYRQTSQCSEKSKTLHYIFICCMHVVHIRIGSRLQQPRMALTGGCQNKRCHLKKNWPKIGWLTVENNVCVLYCVPSLQHVLHNLNIYVWAHLYMLPFKKGHPQFAFIVFANILNTSWFASWYKYRKTLSFSQCEVRLRCIWWPKARQHCRWTRVHQYRLGGRQHFKSWHAQCLITGGCKFMWFYINATTFFK